MAPIIGWIMFLLAAMGTYLSIRYENIRNGYKSVPAVMILVTMGAITLFKPDFAVWFARDGHMGNEGRNLHKQYLADVVPPDRSSLHPRSDSNADLVSLEPHCGWSQKDLD